MKRYSQLKIVERALEILWTESKWTTGAYARPRGNRAGKVDPLDGTAHCFCIEGALRRAALDLGYPESAVWNRVGLNSEQPVGWLLMGLINEKKSKLRMHLNKWNDLSNYRDVVDLLNTARNEYAGAG